LIQHKSLDHFQQRGDFFMHRHFSTRKAGLAGAAAAALLAACGGGSGSAGGAVDIVIPQLSAAQAAAFAGDCADLSARIATLANTSVTAVNKIAAGTLKVAGQDVPEHCQVTGSMYPRTGIDGKPYAIGFEIRLPKNWNGRFYHQGNGGVDGTVVTGLGGLGGGPLTGALFQGFAVLSSDAGHSGATSDFGVDPQARLDYGYQAVAKLTPMAKSVIQSAYGKQPDRSYFGGCSNGGRHAMITATRLPKDYDGILVGSPGYNLPKAAVANLAGARLYATLATTSTVTSAADLATGFTDTERKLLGSKVVDKCDALDGATDGMVLDGAACQAAFNITTDVPTCTGARDGTCLSSAQKTVVAKIFSGTTTSTGALIYSSFPWDSGFGAGAIGHQQRRSVLGVLCVAESGCRLHWDHLQSATREPGRVQWPQLCADHQHRRVGCGHHGDQFDLHRVRHELHDATQPDGHVGAAQPRWQGHCVPRCQRSDLLGDRHRSLVQESLCEPNRATALVKCAQEAIKSGVFARPVVGSACDEAGYKPSIIRHPAHAGTAPCPPLHAQRKRILTRVGQRVPNPSSTTRATPNARCFTKP
jgi:hypothetical protein